MTQVAMPDRPTPLTADERHQISESMARSYFADGFGIFPARADRDLYAAVGSNLACDIASMKPPSLGATAGFLVRPGELGPRIAVACRAPKAGSVTLPACIR